MKAVAVIPARAGSKGISGKNLERVGGITLIQRAVAVCEAAELVNQIVVSSDGSEILDVAERAGAVPLTRPAEISGDTATSESTLLHALSSLPGDRPEIIVMVQCTSPFIEAQYIDTAIRLVAGGVADSVFSGTPSHHFLWRPGPSGWLGVNHDSSERLRRQDRPEEVLETGAFYVMRTAGFLAAQHRFFGRVAPVLVPPEHSVEIDDLSELARARAQAALHDPMARTPRRSDVDALVMDFDGVHTDNAAYVDEDGKESVRVNRSDGMGLAELRSSGLPMLILSTETNAVVARRAEKLGIECISGSEQKLPQLRRWAAENGVAADRILYLGNDLNDSGCLQWVGWPVVVADAHPSVVPIARCMTTAAGGQGAVREVADWLIASPNSVGEP